MTILGAAQAARGGYDPAASSGYAEHPPRMGFFTDTSVCIGCKACEVACKEWNHVPEDGLALTGMSYDNSVGLGADTWRHVAFIEQRKPVAGGQDQFRWLMASDVCKHCTHAACLDVCPTGALFRTEFGTVVVQEDVCNGCGYCVPACPYGVIDRRQDDGRAWKCTLCYDRLGAGMEPACAKACPTESIQFGPLDELRERAAAPGGAAARGRRRRRAAVRGGPGRRRRRGRRVLPAAGRAGGVRAAARSGRDHPRPAGHVAAGRRGRRHAGRGRRRRLRRRRAGRAQVSESEVTREGLRGVRPGRDATPGPGTTPGTGGRAPPAGPGGTAGSAAGRRGEQPMVPPAEFASYYGRPVLNAPVWSPPDIAGYLFLGGLAGGSSLLAAGAQLTGRPALARAAKAAAAGAACLSLAGLVHDLGRPARFLNMLRVFKVTSPMSVGSWILSALRPGRGDRRGLRAHRPPAAHRRGRDRGLPRCSPPGSRPTPRR